MLFESAAAKPGQAGAGSTVSAASQGIAESFHDSDMASVLQRSEGTMLTEGALARLPDHGLLQAAESEPSLHSEKGFVAPERPPAVAKAEPEQRKPIFQFFKTTPEFITTPLVVDGRNCLQPDAHTDGIHFGSWVARPMSECPESRKPLGLEPNFLTFPGTSRAVQGA